MLLVGSPVFSNNQPPLQIIKPLHALIHHEKADEDDGEVDEDMGEKEGHEEDSGEKVAISLAIDEDGLSGAGSSEDAAVTDGYVRGSELGIEARAFVDPCGGAGARDMEHMTKESSTWIG